MRWKNDAPVGRTSPGAKKEKTDRYRLQVKILYFPHQCRVAGRKHLKKNEECDKRPFTKETGKGRIGGGVRAKQPHLFWQGSVVGEPWEKRTTLGTTPIQGEEKKDRKTAEATNGWETFTLEAMHSGHGNGPLNRLGENPQTGKTKKGKKKDKRP